MASVIVVTGDGTEHVVPAEPGLSVMEAIRNAGIDELAAICGGCMSCATCHVHVDPAWSGRLPPMAEGEGDMLDCALGRDATSRLSCQLPFDPEWDGLRVTIGKQA